MATVTQISVEAGPWASDVEPWIGQALATASMQDIRGQVEAGAVLFRVLHGAQTVGAFVLRVDRTEHGPQGVIVAGAAAFGDVDMLATVIPVIEAKFQGVQSIRFHTQKPALVRKMARQGYRVQEVICVKEAGKINGW